MTLSTTCRPHRPTVRGRVPILTLAALLSLPALARGQQTRKGFILNLGLGAARVSTSVGGPGGGSTSHTGVGTDFKIGYAASDQLLVYYSNDAAFHGAEGLDARLVTTGMTGIGVTYFVKPGSPSAYVDGAIGLAAQNVLSTEDGTVDSLGTGWGLAVGGGYEFARHWLLDGDLVMGRLDGNVHTTTLRIGLVWLLY